MMNSPRPRAASDVNGVTLGETTKINTRTSPSFGLRNSLLFDRQGASMSFRSAYVVTSLELFFGLCFIVPFVFGILRRNYLLIAYGSYGILWIFFGLMGLLGLRRRRLSSVSAFCRWKSATILLSLLVTGGVIVMLVLNVTTTSLSLAVALVLVCVFCLILEIWAIGSLIWMRPVLRNLRDPLRGQVQANSMDLSMISKEVQESTLQAPPRPGVVQPEDPRKVAIRMFNKRPEQGVRYMTDRGIADGSFGAIARFLYEAEDVSTAKLGEFLGENTKFNIAVLQSFTEQFNFTKLEFDTALRDFLMKFRLPGEAQKIDRIMNSFAQKYHHDNPGIFPDSDMAYLLSFSLIMLNTDLHNPAIKNKMTRKAFIANNTGIRGKDDIPTDYLEMLYERIQRNEIKMETDSLFTRSQMKGWLEKQNTKHKWQRRWFVLKNNCLYYFNTKEDENPRVIIPLEGLVIHRLDNITLFPAQTGSVFEIADPYAKVLKSVKITPGGPVEGHYAHFILRATTNEEADEWISGIEQNMLGDPLLQLLKKKKMLVQGNMPIPHASAERSMTEFQLPIESPRNEYLDTAPVIHHTDV